MLLTERISFIIVYNINIVNSVNNVIKVNSNRNYIDYIVCNNIKLRVYKKCVYLYIYKRFVNSNKNK